MRTLAYIVWVVRLIKRIFKWALDEDLDFMSASRSSLIYALMWIFRAVFLSLGAECWLKCLKVALRFGVSEVFVGLSW